MRAHAFNVFVALALQFTGGCSDTAETHPTVEQVVVKMGRGYCASVERCHPGRYPDCLNDIPRLYTNPVDRPLPSYCTVAEAEVCAADVTDLACPVPARAGDPYNQGSYRPLQECSRCLSSDGTGGPMGHR